MPQGVLSQPQAFLATRASQGKIGWTWTQEPGSDALRKCMEVDMPSRIRHVFLHGHRCFVFAYHFQLQWRISIWNIF